MEEEEGACLQVDIGSQHKNDLTVWKRKPFCPFLRGYFFFLSLPIHPPDVVKEALSIPLFWSLPSTSRKSPTFMHRMNKEKFCEGA